MRQVPLRMHVVCEGQTEDEFVRFLLAPALREKQVLLLPSCLGKVGHKGGNVGLARLATDVRTRLLGDRRCFCTTFFDYYGLPPEFPGKAEGAGLADVADRQARVTGALERWARETLGEQAASRFLPYVQMHEFEALLFSEPAKLAGVLGCVGAARAFADIRAAFPTPEWIDDSPHSAPSKRIAGLFPAFAKPLHPLLAAQEIGLAAIRRECPLFAEWVRGMEALGEK